MTTRRRLLQGTSLLSLWPFSKAAAAPRRNVYQELGIRPMINCRGTHTSIGASKMWPELHEAMAESSRHYVSLEELQDRVGERLARLTGCEDAMVTTGAAGAICLATAACLTGNDNAKVRQLPNLAGMKTEVVIQKVHRNGYDHAVRNTGVKIVEVESREALAAAVNAETAAMYFLGGTSGDWAYETPVALEECLAVLHKAGVPAIVDAANMLPPWDNVRKLAAAGVDLICISGGKHMRGPQCSGILAGRKELVRAARLNSSPHADSIGRPFKVGREEIVGAWLAAEKYARLDFAALDRQSQGQAEYLQTQLAKLRGLRVSLQPHDRTRRVHRLAVSWDAQELGITADECERQLLEGDPRIAVLRQKRDELVFTMFMNEPGDEKLVARRMREIFGRSRGVPTG